MKINFIIDTDSYVVSFWYSSSGLYDDKILENVELDYIDCYQLIGNKLIINSEKYVLEKAKREHEEHISELKQYLKDTDYIMAETFEKVMGLNNPVTFIADIIKILVEFKNKYADVIAQREEAREELEKD